MGLGRLYPIIKQSKGMFFLRSRAKTKQPLLRQSPENMITTLAGGGNPVPFQQCQHGLPGQLLITA